MPERSGQQESIPAARAREHLAPKPTVARKTAARSGDTSAASAHSIIVDTNERVGSAPAPLAALPAANSPRGAEVNLHAALDEVVLDSVDEFALAAEDTRADLDTLLRHESDAFDAVFKAFLGAQDATVSTELAEALAASQHPRLERAASDAVSFGASDRERAAGLAILARLQAPTPNSQRAVLDAVDGAEDERLLEAGLHALARSGADHALPADELERVVRPLTHHREARVRLASLSLLATALRRQHTARASR